MCRQALSSHATTFKTLRRVSLVDVVCKLFASCSDPKLGWTPFSKAREEDEPHLCRVDCCLLKSAHSGHTSPGAAPLWAQHMRTAGWADSPLCPGGETEARASWRGPASSPCGLGGDQEVEGEALSL